MTEHQKLVLRIRANCNPITGLKPAEYERHVDGIVRMIERSRQRGHR